jgi:cytochrome c peroxidase
LLPQLTSKISADTRVYDNVVENNNLANFAPGGFARIAPVGTGVLLLATDNAEVTNNTITGNDTVGVAVFGLERSGGFDMNEVDVGPQSENVRVHGNMFSGNGRNPDPATADLGIPGADVIWDGLGLNNRFDEPEASTFPPVLPGRGWPDWAYRAYYTILNLAIEQMG